MIKKLTKSLALTMAAGMVAMTFFGGKVWDVQATNEWIGDSQLGNHSTSQPEPDEVLPNENQYNYQKEELAAFCHFGPNTFNEIEWGENYGKKSPSEIFRLKNDFDAETFVKAVKDAGFRKVIVTAKHHDGFCIWASEHTDYDVDATDYPGDARTGRKDILEEISAACTAENIDMGLYLSPWDIHDPSYGYYDGEGRPTTPDKDVLDYNEYYNNQLIEILSNPKYGNNGHFVEVWMDGAKGSGYNAQEYDFKKWFATIQKYEGREAGYKSDCMLFGAGAYTTVRWIGNEKGYAAKNTWSKSLVDYEKNTIRSNNRNGYTLGFENGNQWTVPEADARITSGWFWGTRKKTPKSIADLGSMYFGSVGNNATLLLNIPPNDQGTVDQAILDRMAEFGKNIRDTFADNLAAAETASVKADNIRGNDLAYKPGNTVDRNDKTYWTTDDGRRTGRLLIDLGGIKTFDVVSIEEAILHGQRINSYKVEYRNGKGEWVVLDSGETIGAKRLVRTGAVKGDQVRITVSTPEGKVPMISEVGVFKASEGFELSGTAPDGMDVIDVSDREKFAFRGRWTDQSDPGFVGGTNKYAGKGASTSLEFSGTKVYLVGTKDPNHGTADVYIDDKLIETINTRAASRALGQILFASPDLEDGRHTLRLEVKNKTIGLEAAYVINNGGMGMVGLESNSYTMNENERIDVKLLRVGGDKGKVQVLVSPNPGSAIQDDFNTELNTIVTFEEGQKEAFAQVETRRNKNLTGDRKFSIEMTSQTDKLITGFHDKATVTILDTESLSKEALATLVEEGLKAEEQWYVKGWAAYKKAVNEGAVLLEAESEDMTELTDAAAAIAKAKNGLAARERYTEEDPFVLPWREGSRSALEAEFASELIDDTSNNGRGPWPLVIANRTWASNGKMINALNNGDVVKYFFKAEKAGTYSVTASYRSGSGTNALSWNGEPAGFIEPGTVSAGASDSAKATHEARFTITVNKPGTGVFLLTGPQGNSPQLDKLVFTPENVALNEYTIAASAGEGGSITDVGESTVVEGNAKTYTVTPESGYEIADVRVNGESVGAVGEYTFEDVNANGTIEATFSKINIILKEYTITASAGEGGSITDDGETTVTEGSAKTYTITPQSGYEIADVRVNGESVGAVGEYAFENINANATIEVRFEFSRYTEDTPFYFPTDVNEKPVALEAEYGKMDSGKPVAGEQEEIRVSEDSWASNGKFVNNLSRQDTLSIPYYAQKAGVYRFTAYYRNGGAGNALNWREASGKIEEGTTPAKEEGGSADKVHAVEFDVEVKKAGEGVLIFAGSDEKSIQLDKFEVILKEGSGENKIDKSRLENEIAKAKEEVVKTDIYTAESTAVLHETIESAKEVLEGTKLVQKEMDNQLILLRKSVESLDKILEEGEKKPEGEILTDIHEQAETGEVLKEESTQPNEMKSTEDTPLRSAVDAQSPGKKSEKNTNSRDVSTPGSDAGKTEKDNNPATRAGGNNSPAVKTGDSTESAVWLSTIAVTAVTGISVAALRIKSKKKGRERHL